MTSLRIRDVLFIVVCITLCEEVRGHGRLVEPPSRSSMWRQGYSNPRNYNDNELNCGGAFYQHSVANSKCGTCGDPYKRGKRNNEAGGKYANDIVVRTYKQGQTIPIVVEITAQHGGWFEIRVCPIEVNTKGKGQKVSLECLDKNILKRSDGSGKRTYMKRDDRQGMFEANVVLPSDLVCDRCVIQWKWNAGNSWGTDADTGKGCVGCGNQEQFYGCADVKIERDNGGEDVTKVTEKETTTKSHVDKTTVTKVITTTEEPTRTTTTEATETTDNNDCRTASKGLFKNMNLDSWCKTNCAAGYCPPAYCECGASKKPKKICKTTTIGPYSMTDLDSWCMVNCNRGFCPRSHCECKGDKKKPKRKSKKCKTTDTGPHRFGNYDSWCESNCKRGNCPSNFCKCS